MSEEGAEVISEWKEPRMKDGQRFVGLAASGSGIYTCTSNGALRRAKPTPESEEPVSDVASLPMRLCEWRLASNEEAFAYAGDEVELSIWNTEKTFSKESTEAASISDSSKKRKRNDELLPGEIWRAKNLPNDHLNLRQPVRNTSLAYIQPSTSASQHHLLVGTQFGDIRRYDTRAARRPVANWKGIGKVGAISVIEKGCSEHEAFAADSGSNLYALDLRNGKVAYTYKGISGAITSFAPRPSFLASVGRDRFLRLHSTFSPSAELGQHQANKGEVLDKLYMQVVPTAVVADPNNLVNLTLDKNVDDEAGDEGDEDVWDQMEDVESDTESRQKGKKSKQT